jgi:hypothetical protein
VGLFHDNHHVWAVAHLDFRQGDAQPMMRAINFVALMVTFIVLSLFIDGAFFWAALLLGGVQLVEFLIEMSEDE